MTDVEDIVKHLRGYEPGEPEYTAANMLTAQAERIAALEQKVQMFGDVNWDGEIVLTRERYDKYQAAEAKAATLRAALDEAVEVVRRMQNSAAAIIQESRDFLKTHGGNNA